MENDEASELDECETDEDKEPLPEFDEDERYLQYLEAGHEY